METQDTRFARSGDAHIAYQVVGDHEFDLVWMPSWATHVELMWDDPSMASFVRRLARFARVLLFDRRGVGLSDPLPATAMPSIEAWVDDLGAVMDAAGSERAVIAASDVAAFIALLFAAARPDRTAGLVLVNATARVRRADDYPAGLPDRTVEAFVESIESGWGTTAPTVAISDPSVPDNEASRLWWSRYQRATASPGTMAAMARMLVDIDVRGVLASIGVPTLVMHRVDDGYLRVGHGRYLAKHIPSADYRDLAGHDHSPDVGDASTVLDAIEEFVTGRPPSVHVDRVLSTVMITDIVGSTQLAARLGDREWSALLDRHLQVVDRQLARFGGRRVQTTGDGIVAVFDGPARGVRCACALRDALRSIELTIRAGVHTGEIEVVDNDIAGLGVHIAARISSLAGDGEVVVSRTVKDLVAGSGLAFEDRGTHTLKGVPEQWQVLTVTST